MSFEALTAIKNVILPITERELSKTPEAGLKALLSLNNITEFDHYDTSEMRLKNSVIQLVLLDLERVQSAKNPIDASVAYLALSRSMIRLARTLIIEDQNDEH
tara:strand:+ start:304 stop:612 length:309 start_codon:yes stop_codon:yes gene_type:complete